MRATNSPELRAVRELLRTVPLIDGHNDLPWQLRSKFRNDLGAIDLRSETQTRKAALATNLPRLRAGCLGAQFWAAYVPSATPGPEAVQAAIEQIDLVHRLAARYPDTLQMARSAADIVRIHRRGRIASLIGIEGGHCLNNSPAVLRMAYALGVRYLTLTHVRNTAWADAAGDTPVHHGLTPLGEEIVREMNRLGMMVDLAHVTDETMRAALLVSKAPVIFSHSSAWGVCRNARNVPDDVLEAVRANGGVVMVCFLPGYLTEPNSAHHAKGAARMHRLEGLYPARPEKVRAAMEAWWQAHPWPGATLSDVADHIDHVRKAAGIDHVGIGSDFDGFPGSVKGLEDVSRFPALLAELLRRGYSRADIAKVAGQNLLRVFRDVERAGNRRGSP